MKNIAAVFLILTFLGVAPNAMAQETPQAAIDNGNFPQALALLQHQCSDPNPETAIAGFAGRAQIALSKNDIATAEQMLAEAQKLAAALPKKSGWRVVVPWLYGELARDKGDADGAVQYLKTAQARIDAGAEVSPGWKGSVQYTLALLTMADNARARKSAENAIAAFNEAKMLHEKAHASILLGDLEWARSKQRRAFIEYDDALRALEKTAGSIQCKAKLQLLIAQRHIEANELRQAAARLEQAKKDIEDAGNPMDFVSQLKSMNQKVSP